MEIFISLFFAFSVLTTVWLAEMAVFLKNLRKKKHFLEFQRNDVYEK